ncbi:MAG: response regulator [Luteolibacter sp.]
MGNELVCIVDDEAGVRKALGRLLRLEGFAVRDFASAGEFLETYPKDETVCLVLDVSMPGLDGLELQKHLVSAGVPIPIVFLTGNGDIPMTVHAIKSGAVDFLTKPVNDTDLLRAVRAGVGLAASRRTERLEIETLHRRYATLTPREREVMAHVVTGALNKQIAAELGTGEQNIKIHRGRVMAKMEVESVADLVRTAQRLGVGK